MICDNSHAHRAILPSNINIRTMAYKMINDDGQYILREKKKKNLSSMQ